MSAEQLSEALEPFVTSKPQGQGLGLFLARSIAERLGGQLVLQSTPGQGTEARLELACDFLKTGPNVHG
jgi:two-component system sensor histidine kinase RegB